VLYTTPDCEYLTKPEISLLIDLTQVAPLYKLDQIQALTYCKVLISADEFSLTQTHKVFKGMADDFWKELLTLLQIPV